jgi:hypothetical protein
MRTSKMAAIAADRDRWEKQAFAACISAVRELIDGEIPPINPSLKVGLLADSEWGWIVSTIVWAWISTRAEQAATEGWGEERAIRSTGLESDPWLAVAVAAILPKLVEQLDTPDYDWSQPVSAWSKNDVVGFLLAAFGLIQRAVEARDAEEAKLAGKTSPDVVARRMNAAAGNPLMTIDELKELNDRPPF